MRVAEITDDQEDTTVTYNPVQGVLLGHTILSMQEVARPFHVMHHKSGPVAVSLRSKPCATRPLILDGPQHGCPILLIECISRVNDKEAPVLLLDVLLPHKVNCMGATLNTSLHLPTQLVSATCFLCLWTIDFLDALGNQPPPSHPHAHRQNPRFFIQADEADRH